ncbi:hypothetical protein RDI58_024073 [Solanum bulbocastanum]|uniref:Uncharacterized protein n=1 Tax=Solanum bulbocastanum TaxID=147425 RepID=A0AAN8Y387_SOLBU
MQPPKRSRRRRSTPSTRRTWTPTEESTLINGLKELCVNGWRADNGTFRATGEHAEGPLDVAEDILKSRTSGLSTDMSLGFLINVDDDEYEDESSHGPNAPTEEAENTDTRHNFTQTTENEYAGGSPREHTGHLKSKENMLKHLLVSMKEKKARKGKGLWKMLMKHFSRVWRKL